MHRYLRMIGLVIGLIAIQGEARLVHASNTLQLQHAVINQYSHCIALYFETHKEYPVSDASGSWYEKLVAGNYVRRDPDFGLSSTQVPLDFYGRPLVYELPTPTNGNQIVIRSIGVNGIDDQGLLDDLDSRFGVRDGYWYKSRWPAARFRAWVCGILALLGTVVIGLIARSWWLRKLLWLNWWGLLGAVVLPWGFDRGPLGSTTTSVDPVWLVYVGAISSLLLLWGLIYAARVGLAYVMAIKQRS